MMKLTSRIFIIIVSLLQVACNNNPNKSAINEFPETVATVYRETSNSHDDDASGDTGFKIEWEDGNVSDFFDKAKDAVTSINIFKSGAGDSTDKSVVSTKSNDPTLAGQQQKQAVAIVADNNTQVEQTTDKQKEEVDDDWRKKRKWWQRGTPVL